MKSVVLIIIGVFAIFGQNVFADDNYQKWTREIYIKKRLQISFSEPERFNDTSLREVNLNDVEVRDIVSKTQEIIPGAIVTVDGVKNECPCENGPNCTAEVWVVTNKKDKIGGIMLSKIAGLWVVGPIQRWYLEEKEITEKIRSAMEKNEALESLIEEQYKHTDEAPQCLDTDN